MLNRVLTRVLDRERSGRFSSSRVSYKRKSSGHLVFSELVGR